MCTDVYHSSKSKVTVVQNTRLGGKGKSLVSQRRFPDIVRVEQYAGYSELKIKKPSVQQMVFFISRSFIKSFGKN